MRKHKVLAIYVALLCLSTLIFQGCSKGEDNKDSRTHIKIWVSKDSSKKSILLASRDFCKNFNVVLEVYVVTDIVNQFKTAAIAGKGPDAFMWAHDVTGPLAENGLLDSMYIPAEYKASFFPQSIDAFMYNGRLYGLPVGMEGLVLFYNKKFVKRPPKTVEEMINMGKKLQKQGIFGLLAPVTDFYYMFPFFAAAEMRIWPREHGRFDTTRNDLASPGAVEAGRLIARLTDDSKGKPLIPHDTKHEMVRSLFYRDKAAMILSGPWALDNLNRSGMDYGIAPIPSFKGRPARPFLGVVGFFFNRTSKNKLLLRQWADSVVLSKEGQKLLNSLDPKVPARKDAYRELAAKKKFWFLKSMKAGLEHGIPMPNIPQMNSVFGIMQRTLTIIASHKASPEDALKEASKYLQQAQKEKE